MSKTEQRDHENTNQFLRWKLKYSANMEPNDNDIIYQSLRTSEIGQAEQH